MNMLFLIWSEIFLLDHLFSIRFSCFSRLIWFRAFTDESKHLYLLPFPRTVLFYPTIRRQTMYQPVKIQLLSLNHLFLCNIIYNLKNLISFCRKRDPFDCVEVQAREFRFPVHRQISYSLHLNLNCIIAI